MPSGIVHQSLQHESKHEGHIPPLVFIYSCLPVFIFNPTRKEWRWSLWIFNWYYCEVKMSRYVSYVALNNSFVLMNSGINIGSRFSFAIHFLQGCFVYWIKFIYFHYCFCWGVIFKSSKQTKYLKYFCFNHMAEE